MLQDAARTLRRLWGGGGVVSVEAWEAWLLLVMGGGVVTVEALKHGIWGESQGPDRGTS